MVKKKLSIVIITISIFLSFNSCGKYQNTTEQGSKLDSISTKQQIISSQVENFDGNIKDLEKSISKLEKTVADLKKSISQLQKDIKNVASNDPSKKPDPNKKHDIPIGDSFVLGPKDAKVTIIEWTDFQ